MDVWTMDARWKVPPLMVVITLVGVWWKSGDVLEITGKVHPEIGLIGKDIILSCQVKGCTSSSLEVCLFKWGHSKKNALYIYNSTMQNEVQESSRGESHKNGSHKGQYKEGLLEVTLLQVQTADSGQYICAMTCGRVHKAVVMEVIVKDVVNVTVGEDAILPCQLMETHEPSYLKLQWRRICPGKSQTIYSYLYQDTCPVIYSEDRLGDKCSCSNRPHIREQFGEKYKQKAEVFKGNELRNWNCSLKLNNIHKYDAGKYVSSVRFNSLHKVCILNLSVRGNASVIGNVIHEIGQTGQDLILSCKVRGCTPTKLHVQLYKWDSSKNKTLYSYSSTKERHRDQKSSPGDKHDDGIHRGQYKDGVLEVTLLKVQTVDSGQYVCAMTCDHVYSEAIMEVRVEEFHDQNTEILMSYYFVWLYFLYVFLIVLCIFTKIGKCNKENEEPKHAVDEPRKFNNEINIQNYFTDELKEISEELRKLRCEFEGFRSEAAWRRTHKHAANITLAVASAHPNLSIAVDKKSFTVKAPHLLVSPNPQRFDGILSVLGSQGFSSGQHYWAVDVSSSTEWDLGVARESIKRKGEISLSPKEGFWVLGLCGKDFWAKTDPWTRVTVQRKPTKIGVFLNFLENEITFFNGTDRSVLFAFKDCLFLEDIYPFFKNTHKGTTIRICSIK